MTNPLLQSSHAPVFSQMQPEHIMPAIEQSIAKARAFVAQQLDSIQQPNWDNFILPLNAVDSDLERLWSQISHLNAVVNTPELRQAHDAAKPLISDYQTWCNQHSGLYQVYQNIKDSQDFATLSQGQQKSIDDRLRDFKLAGVALPEEKKQRYAEIKNRLSTLAANFANNVLDATQHWHKLIEDKADLSGVPENTLALLAQQAQDKGQQGYRLNLDFPCYLPVMSYCDNRALREEMYTAFVIRASSGQWDNSPLIAEIVSLRHELAQLLGFNNYAEQSLASKMAESPTEVMAFLQQLAEQSKPQAAAELQSLQDYAKTEYQLAEFEAWDMFYYSEKLKQHQYAVDDEQLRPYFPAAQVLNGLFATVKRLFAIDVKAHDGVDVWHPDVRCFDIFDQEQQLRGRFYLDLYAREGKRGGAWMADYQGCYRRLDGSVQLPIAFLSCNFSAPVGDKPALLTHREVVTLFHEFGHGLHHMLTLVDESPVAGINGVPWDAVELPSQFLENWCWEPEALNLISAHYQTGEPLPQAMLEKMLAAKNFHSALQMLRQLEFAVFDFRLHLEFDPEQGANAQALLDAVRAQIAVVIPPAFNRFQNSFNHIFSGGYAAGYYSYKWAEVLSADAFSRFETEGIFNPQTGQDFLHGILEQGGTQAPMQLFAGFRGRAPEITALLRHNGIAE